MNVCGGSTHSQKTIATVNGTALGRAEGHSRFNPTQSAFDRDLDSLARKRLTVRLHVGGDPVILFYFTGLAPLRIVLQPFVGKEELFSSSEDKLFVAINTSQYLILIFVHCRPPTPCSRAGSVLPVLRDRSASFFLMAVSYFRSALKLSPYDLITYLFFARRDHIHFPDFLLLNVLRQNST
jgi:hypothetical protein